MEVTEHDESSLKKLQTANSGKEKRMEREATESCECAASQVRSGSSPSSAQLHVETVQPSGSSTPSAGHSGEAAHSPTTAVTYGDMSGKNSDSGRVNRLYNYLAVLRARLWPFSWLLNLFSRVQHNRPVTSSVRAPPCEHDFFDWGKTSEDENRDSEDTKEYTEEEIYGNERPDEKNYNSKDPKEDTDDKNCEERLGEENYDSKDPKEHANKKILFQDDEDQNGHFLSPRADQTCLNSNTCGDIPAFMSDYDCKEAEAEDEIVRGKIQMAVGSPMNLVTPENVMSSLARIYNNLIQNFIHRQPRREPIQHNDETIFIEAKEDSDSPDFATHAMYENNTVKLEQSDDERMEMPAGCHKTGEQQNKLATVCQHTETPMTHTEQHAETPMTHTEQHTEAPMTHTEQHTETPMTHTEQHTETPMTHTKQHTETPVTHTEQHTEKPVTHTEQHTETPVTHTEQHTEKPVTHTEQHTETPMTHTKQHTETPVTHTEQHTETPVTHTEKPVTHTEQHTETPVTHTEQHTETPVTHTEQHTEKPVTHTEQHTETPVTHTEQHTETPVTHTEQHTEKPVTHTEQHTETPVTHTEQHTETPVTHTEQHTETPVTHTEQHTETPVTHTEQHTETPMTHTDSELHNSRQSDIFIFEQTGTFSQSQTYSASSSQDKSDRSNQLEESSQPSNTVVKPDESHAPDTSHDPNNESGLERVCQSSGKRIISTLSELNDCKTEEREESINDTVDFKTEEREEWTDETMDFKTEEREEGTSETIDFKTEEREEWTDETMDFKTEEREEWTDETMDFKTEEREEGTSETMDFKTEEREEGTSETMDFKTEEREECTSETMDFKAEEREEGINDTMDFKTEEREECINETVDFKTEEREEGINDTMDCKTEEGGNTDETDSCRAEKREERTDTTSDRCCLCQVTEGTDEMLHAPNKPGNIRKASCFDRGPSGQRIQGPDQKLASVQQEYDSEIKGGGGHEIPEQSSTPTEDDGNKYSTAWTTDTFHTEGGKPRGEKCVETTGIRQQDHSQRLNANNHNKEQMSQQRDTLTPDEQNWDTSKSDSQGPNGTTPAAGFRKQDADGNQAQFQQGLNVKENAKKQASCHLITPTSKEPKENISKANCLEQNPRDTDKTTELPEQGHQQNVSANGGPQSQTPGSLIPQTSDPNKASSALDITHSESESEDSSVQATSHFETTEHNETTSNQTTLYTEIGSKTASTPGAPHLKAWLGISSTHKASHVEAELETTSAHSEAQPGILSIQVAVVLEVQLETSSAQNTSRQQVESGAPSVPVEAPSVLTGAPPSAPAGAPSSAPTGASSVPTGASSVPTGAPPSVPTGAPPSVPTGAPSVPTRASLVSTAASSVPTRASSGALSVPSGGLSEPDSLQSDAYPEDESAEDAYPEDESAEAAASAAAPPQQDDVEHLNPNSHTGQATGAQAGGSADQSPAPSAAAHWSTNQTSVQQSVAGVLLLRGSRVLVTERARATGRGGRWRRCGPVVSLAGVHVDLNCDLDAPPGPDSLPELLQLGRRRALGSLALAGTDFQGRLNSAASTGQDSLLEEFLSPFRRQQREENRMCLHCQDHIADTVFLNCHDIVVCYACARYMLQWSCCPSPGCGAVVLCYVYLG